MKWIERLSWDENVKDIFNAIKWLGLGIMIGLLLAGLIAGFTIE